MDPNQRRSLSADERRLLNQRARDEQERGSNAAAELRDRQEEMSVLQEDINRQSASMSYHQAQLAGYSTEVNILLASLLFNANHRH